MAITPLPQASLREMLTRHVDLRALTKSGNAEPAHPPQWLVAAIDDRGDWPGIRELVGVSEVPVLRSDGSICQTPGYDPATGVLLVGSGATSSIPPNPTIDDARRAIEVLHEVVCDFRFEAPEHRSAWLAALLTPLARFVFTGPAPLFLADANVRGAGKTLLMEIIAQVVLGHAAPVFSYAHDADEMRKKITSIAIAGDHLVWLDNLAGPFGNETLARALTATRWRDRLLGKNEIADVPLLATWYATGNNVAVAADTVRRIIHIRLDVLDEYPENRGGFRHPDLCAWVRQNRGRLLGAALTILAGYLRAGKPQQYLKPFGSFNGWSDIIRAALVWAAQPDPCWTIHTFSQMADMTTDALRNLLQAWRSYDPQNSGMVVSNLIAKMYEDARHHDAFSLASQKDPHAEALRAAIELFCGCRAGQRPSARQLGNKLRAVRRRVVSDLMFDVVPSAPSVMGQFGAL